MNREDYIKLLEHHDWYFQMSDDFRVWEKGQKNLDKLLWIAGQNSEFRNLFNEYQEKRECINSSRKEMSEETCLGCEYLKERTCRRFPPQPKILVPTVFNGENCYAVVTYDFPRVEKRCGEYKGKHGRC